MSEVPEKTSEELIGEGWIVQAYTTNRAEADRKEEGLTKAGITRYRRFERKSGPGTVYEILIPPARR